MRLPRARLTFTVRTMMVAVAITATFLGLLEERRARFGRVSLAHRLERAQVHVSDLEFCLVLTPTQMGHNPSARAVKAEDERIRETLPFIRFIMYHDMMAYKYERASGQPWLPVAADPPPPPKPSREYMRVIIDRYIKTPVSDTAGL
jgi:hypothetical protein